jgi:hypothetical protein
MLKTRLDKSNNKDTCTHKEYETILRRLYIFYGHGPRVSWTGQEELRNSNVGREAKYHILDRP